jgi:hypothetical protein
MAASIVWLAGLMHKLTQNVDGMHNVGPSDNESNGPQDVDKG